MGRVGGTPYLRLYSTWCPHVRLPRGGRAVETTRVLVVREAPRRTQARAGARKTFFARVDGPGGCACGLSWIVGEWLVWWTGFGIW